MFLFNCCRSVDSNSGYYIRKKNTNNQTETIFVSSLKQVNEKDLNNPKLQILQVEKSQYNDLIKQYQGTDKKWTDVYFPPDQNSLGNIPNVTTDKWKRISDMLNKPALFDGKIQPKDVIQGSLGNCYFLSALASLAQKQQRIKAVFSDQAYNPNGIYKVTLRINGQIQQILVDDFVPVNNRGEPLFCQPNKNQFWVLLLEKAWAKAHGSYANIIAGTPSQVFKAVTYAPAQTHFVKQSEEQRQKIWRLILEHSKKNHPCCCGTDQRSDVDWDKIGLVEGHAYTLIDASELQQQNGKIERMLLMRNPWGKMQWQGSGSENDNEFWKSIKPSEQKKKFLSNIEKANDGIFFMNFVDFCKYFSQMHFCMLLQNGNYLAQKLYCDKKHGSLYSFTVQNPGVYIFELHQTGMRGQQTDRIQEGLSRSTLLIGRQSQKNKQYQFVEGCLKYNDQDTTLKVQLAPGSYLLYAKLDPTRTKQQIPNEKSVSVYSVNLITLKTQQQKLHPQFLSKMFLSHARLNKRQVYNNGTMWIAWKLLYQQGGYAYIAFGNSSESQKKFVITFDQDQFDKLNFKLKKPYKKKGNHQVLQILPGTQKIILARVKNLTFKGLKFPPQIDIKLEKLDNQSQIAQRDV